MDSWESENATFPARGTSYRLVDSEDLHLASGDAKVEECSEMDLCCHRRGVCL